MEVSDASWSYLALPRAIWNYLELAGACSYLALSGAIWRLLELPEAICSYMQLSRPIRSYLDKPTVQQRHKKTKPQTHNPKPHTHKPKSRRSAQEAVAHRSAAPPPWVRSELNIHLRTCKLKSLSRIRLVRRPASKNTGWETFGSHLSVLFL